MSDGGNLMTAPSSESATARLGKAFASWKDLKKLISVTYGVFISKPGTIKAVWIKVSKAAHT